MADNSQRLEIAELRPTEVTTLLPYPNQNSFQPSILRVFVPSCESFIRYRRIE